MASNLQHLPNPGSPNPNPTARELLIETSTARNGLSAPEIPVGRYTGRLACQERNATTRSSGPRETDGICSVTISERDDGSEVGG